MELRKKGDRRRYGDGVVGDGGGKLQEKGNLEGGNEKSGEEDQVEGRMCPKKTGCRTCRWRPFYCGSRAYHIVQCP